MNTDSELCALFPALPCGEQPALLLDTHSSEQADRHRAVCPAAAGGCLSPGNISVLGAGEEGAAGSADSSVCSAGQPQHGLSLLLALTPLLCWAPDTPGHSPPACLTAHTVQGCAKSTQSSPRAGLSGAGLAGSCSHLPGLLWTLHCADCCIFSCPQCCTLSCPHCCPVLSLLHLILHWVIHTST